MKDKKIMIVIWDWVIIEMVKVIYLGNIVNIRWDDNVFVGEMYEFKRIFILFKGIFDGFF